MATEFSKLRLQTGCTAEQLAAELGYSERQVYRWETGETKPRKAVLDRVRDLAGRPAEPVPFAGFTFIDLFAGIGGLRTAFDDAGGRCVFTSEWDKYAQLTYQANHRDNRQNRLGHSHETVRIGKGRKHGLSLYSSFRASAMAKGAIASAASVFAARSPSPAPKVWPVITWLSSSLPKITTGTNRGRTSRATSGPLRLRPAVRDAPTPPNKNIVILPRRTGRMLIRLGV